MFKNKLKSILFFFWEGFVFLCTLFAIFVFILGLTGVPT